MTYRHEETRAPGDYNRHTRGHAHGQRGALVRELRPAHEVEQPVTLRIRIAQEFHDRLIVASLSYGGGFDRELMAGPRT